MYNSIHDSAEHEPEIQRLREIHVELDESVAEAYDWTDIHLGHGFHKTAQGVRFTIGPDARREVLRRLLALNHERHAEEEASGLLKPKRGRAQPQLSLQEV
jgi:hypothetical protein